MIALQLNAQEGAECKHAERLFGLVSQRSGILLASVCPEIEYRAQNVLMQLMAKILPHRGALSPMHSHFCPVPP